MTKETTIIVFESYCKLYEKIEYDGIGAASLIVMYAVGVEVDAKVYIPNESVIFNV